MALTPDEVQMIRAAHASGDIEGLLAYCSSLKPQVLGEGAGEDDLPPPHIAIAEVLTDYAFALRVTDEGGLVNEWVTGNFEAITGYHPDDIQSPADWEQMIYPHDLLLAGEHVQKVMSGKSDTVEFRILNKAHEVRWIRSIVRPLIDPHTQRITRIYGVSKDITAEHTEAHHEAATPPAPSSYMVRSHKIGGWDWQPRKGVFMWGDNLKIMLGYAVQDLADTFAAFVDCIYPADREAVLASFERVVQGEAEEVIGEYRMVGRDGAVRWFSLQGLPTKDSSGAVVRVVGASTDISDQKTAEAEHQRLEQQYRALVRNLPDITVYLYDNDLRIVLVEGTDLSTIGLDPAQLIGVCVADIPMLLPHLNHYQATLRGEVSMVEDGTDSGYFRLHFQPLYGSDHRITGGMVVAQDVTEMVQARHLLENLNHELEARVVARTAELAEAKRLLESQIAAQMVVEQALRESEQRFYTAFQAALMPMTIADKETGRYVEVNEAFLSTFGYTRDEVVGRTAIEINLWVSLDDFLDLVRRLMATGRVVNYEVGLCTKSGQVRECVTGAELVELGGVECVLAIVTDLTDYKQALRTQERIQQQLFHADRLTAIGKVAASIAHEMNNPLQAVYGALNLAAKDPTNQRQVELYLTISLTEVERMMAIVRRMREMHQVGTLQKKRIDLNANIEDVALLLRKKAQEQHIGIDLRLAPNLPSFMAEGEQIRQVMLNLMLNALEAMPDGGQVTVTTTHDPSAGRLHVRVCDTGAGFADMQRAFEPFYTTKDKGLGLGLSIVEQILERHGGTIAIEPQAQGVCLHIQLPAGA